MAAPMYSEAEDTIKVHNTFLYQDMYFSSIAGIFKSSHCMYLSRIELTEFYYTCHMKKLKAYGLILPKYSMVLFLDATS